MPKLISLRYPACYHGLWQDTLKKYEERVQQYEKEQPSYEGNHCENGEDHVHGNGCRYPQREKYPAVMRLSAPINIMPIAS